MSDTARREGVRGREFQLGWMKSSNIVNSMCFMSEYIYTSTCIYNVVLVEVMIWVYRVLYLCTCNVFVT